MCKSFTYYVITHHGEEKHMQDLIELSKRIHKQNVELGWWDNERSINTMICLLHSELSEAMEGDRKNLMDDKLPEYPMFWVELADFCIRCLDWYGATGSDEHREPNQLTFGRNTDLLAFLHFGVSALVEHPIEPKIDPTEILVLLVYAIDYAEHNGINIMKIIDKKLAFNQTREDHKRENRAKTNGKKY